MSWGNGSLLGLHPLTGMSAEPQFLQLTPFGCTLKLTAVSHISPFSLLSSNLVVNLLCCLLKRFWLPLIATLQGLGYPGHELLDQHHFF